MRRLLAGFALALGIAAASASHACPVQFGWTGTVTAVDPMLAASLPVNSGIQVGTRVRGRYVFESTTGDVVTSTTEGRYPGAILDWQVQVGIYSISHLARAARATRSTT